MSCALDSLVKALGGNRQAFPPANNELRAPLKDTVDFGSGRLNGRKGLTHANSDSRR
jgi:hypothetical protein